MFESTFYTCGSLCRVDASFCIFSSGDFRVDPKRCKMGDILLNESCVPLIIDVRGRIKG